MDLDYASGKINYLNADKIINFITENNLKRCWLIETHVHADHLPAAPYIQQNLGGKIAISREIVQVQEIFGKVFNAGTEFERDGSQFDLLLEDGDTYEIGNLRGKALHTPGHTPACMAHVIEDTVFVGDTLFMPDGGTARADFPGGDARTLFRSIQKILALPDNTRMFVCHDYMPNGREVKWETTVSEQKQNNIMNHICNFCNKSFNKHQSYYRHKKYFCKKAKELNNDNNILFIVNAGDHLSFNISIHIDLEYDDIFG